MSAKNLCVALLLVLCVHEITAAPKIYGVNIGGLFALESWIVPSLFEKVNNAKVIDEWTWGQYFNSTAGRALLENHWDTWYQDSDFKDIASYGLTHIRIPIGYWIVLSQEELNQYKEPYITGSWPYLVRVIGWAKKYNLKVLIDLHGVPGSQNGWDHSGRLGSIGWGTGDTVQRTLTYLQRLASKLVDLENSSNTSDTVWGLELMNEPLATGIQGGLATVKNFYLAAYPLLRKILPAEKYTIVIQQAFSTDWVGFMPSPQYQNVILDLHTYQSFDDRYNSYTESHHITEACGLTKHEVTSMTLPTVTGEWSLVFNGGTDQGKFLVKYGLAQMNSYESGDGARGWFFWAWKTETSELWSYRAAVQKGWLPSKLPTNEQEPQNCFWWCDTNCCLPNPSASTADIQSSVTWACTNGGVDCAQLINSPNSVFYMPNDLMHHAAVVFNTYWEAHKSEGSAQACHFDGAARFCASNCAGSVNSTSI